MPRGSRTRWVLLLLVAVAAIACYVVAIQRHEKIGDIARPLVGPSGPVRDIDVFSPFTVGNAYLWVGLGIGLTVAFVVLLVGLPRRRLLFPLMIGLLIGGALAGAAYAQIERDSPRAALRSGIYVAVEEEPGDGPGESVAPVFDPFNWRSPYLALGLAGGLLIGFLAVVVVARSPAARNRGPRAPASSRGRREWR